MFILTICHQEVNDIYSMRMERHWSEMTIISVSLFIISFNRRLVPVSGIRARGYIVEGFDPAKVTDTNISGISI